jgi:hypothetical protein
MEQEAAHTLGAEDTVYRLVTTICDPEAAPATELAGLYAQRWEIETALDEIKRIKAATSSSCAPNTRQAPSKNSTVFCSPTMPYAT